MVYTEYGLCIGLDELKELVKQVENENKYHNMESCIYIKGGEKPEIKQYCYYAECNPVYYTNGVKDERGQESMSAGKWKIGSQFIEGRWVYRIYRLKDASAANRPKNREYYDDILYTDGAALQAMVNKLNAEEERGVR